MIAHNGAMKGETLWFRPVFSIKDSRERETVGQGKPWRSEAAARNCARRIGRAFLAAGVTVGWSIGVGRSFNRASTPSTIRWGDDVSLEIPDLPPLPPLTGPKGS